MLVGGGLSHEMIRHLARCSERPGSEPESAPMVIAFPWFANLAAHSGPHHGHYPIEPRGNYGTRHTTALQAANAAYVDVFMGDFNWVCGIASNGSVVCPINDYLPPPGATGADLTALGNVTSVAGFIFLWRCAIAGGTGRCWGNRLNDPAYPLPSNLGPVIALGDGRDTFACWITGAASGPSGELRGVEGSGPGMQGICLRRAPRVVVLRAASPKSARGHLQVAAACHRARARSTKHVGHASKHHKQASNAICGFPSDGCAPVALFSSQ